MIAGFLIIELLLLFFISKQLTSELYYFFYKITKSESFTFRILAFIFLPGTFLHELSHLVIAFILFLRVKNFSIWPEFRGKEIKLGKVVYLKRDFISSFIVGIAPVFGGLALFYTLFYFHFFPNMHWQLNIIFGYLLFIASLTMFSSKQDMIDAIYMIPVILMIFFCTYIFNINLYHVFQNSKIVLYLVPFITNLTKDLGYILISTIGILIFFKFINKK